MAYIIKRYSNRKMYDQQASRYVALDEIKQLIQKGTEIRVEDAESGADLTSLTLTQILLETERAHQAAVPSTLLHHMIQHGEAWYGFLDRVMRNSSQDPLSGTPGDVARFWADWTAGANSPQETAPEPAPPWVDSVESELSALKEKLQSLEQRLGDSKDRTGPARPARATPRRRR